MRKLRGEPVEITLIDRRNFHLFQPLTYQVATGALSAGEIAYPLRAIFHDARNVNVILAEVVGFDLARRRIRLADARGVPAPDDVAYDTLIVAAGSSYSYFGHEEFREFAHEVKTLESAIGVSSQILRAFERAELATDPADRDAELTFVIVGAGPTGVEMAGQIGELARDTLPKDFRQIDSRSARVLLVDTVDRVLPAFPAKLSDKARRSVERLGVTPMLGRTVVGVDADGVSVKRRTRVRGADPRRHGDLGGRGERVGAAGRWPAPRPTAAGGSRSSAT